MGTYNETRSVVASLATIEDAIEDLDAAAAKLEAKITRDKALLARNREQKRRLELGMQAIKTTRITESEQ